MVKVKPISAPYYNIGQLRVYYWNQLKNQTTELARCHKGSANEKAHIQTIKGLLKDLHGVECYFAFPGMQRLTRLDSALARHEHAALAHQVADCTRMLVSDSYRSHPDVSDDDAHALDQVEQQSTVAVRKNYFEVMYVEDLNDQEEQLLRQQLGDLRDPNEPLTDAVVVQRSFQDALITLLFNYNIQAVVIRYAPPFQDRYQKCPTGLLRHESVQIHPWPCGHLHRLSESAH